MMAILSSQMRFWPLKKLEMKKILLILFLLPVLLNAQNLRRWGGTGTTNTLHGNWFYNSHPTYATGDTLKLVDFRLLKDSAAALRSAMGGGSGMSIGGTVTSGTTGSVLFVGGSSALTQDNSNFFWDNSNKRLGIGTSSPSYRLDIQRAATGQTATSRTFNVSTTGSTFNVTSGALTNHAGYFSADASVSAGGFALTNIGIMGHATGGDNNFGVATSNSSFTGYGKFYQSANNTTKIEGGPGTDNISFGPSNSIKLNTPLVLIPSGGLSVGANADNGIGTLQVYGKLTVSTIDSSASPANMIWQDPATGEIKKAAVPSGGSLGYNVYTALVSQSSTSNPTATVLGTNTIGTIVWTRTSAGAYDGTLSGAFTSNKTWLISQVGDGTGSFLKSRLSWTSANVVHLTIEDNSNTLTDGFSNLSIEIRVYP